MPEDAPPPAAAVFRFDRFELRPRERVLLADGESVRLGGRAFDMLVALVARRDRVVSKRELMDVVWPKLVVEENNLQAQVMALRKVMGPAAIATVPGRGYRITLPVRATDAPAPADVPAAPDPASAPPAPRRTNVAAHLPPMFGRADDVAAVRALLDRHSLVSVVGAGGIGKTRLAQAFAAEAAGRYPDGAWLVELASLADPALVGSAVARTLGIALSTERAANDVVASVLRAQRMLLVLDNCEHLIDGVVALVEALQRAAPDVRLLVTSQEPLRAVDEHVYRLASLAVPATVAADDARTYSAVELFVAAAKAADPRFALTKRNAGAVVDICRRLDGIPLALQLAAARVPLLGVEGLRARLDERFHVLTGGARTVLRRHQTLRGALEWSHALLTAEEQAVFRRLGVFAGSFTLDAVQKVACDPTLSEWHVLEHLGALVDKSLVVAEGEDVPRYRLLETARAFALERLGEAGETDEYLRRHAIVLRDTVAALTANRWRQAPGQSSALAAELDNARAAVAWATAAADERPLAVELHFAASRVWHACALLAESLAHCLAARRLLNPTIPPATEARFWLALARSGVYSPNPECFAAAQRAATMFRELGEPDFLYEALTSVAVIGARRGASAAIARALAEAERIEDPGWPSRQRAQLQFAHYMWAMMDGRFVDALAFAQRQRDLYREDGSAAGVEIAAANVGSALLALDQPEAALAEVRPAAARLEALGAGASAGHVIGIETIALVMLGRHDEALSRARAAFALLQREGDTLWLLEPLAWSAALQGRHADAARIAGFADALGARLGDVRRASVQKRRDAIDALLAASLPDAVRRALLAEGAAMREGEAFALALGAPA
ncbi:MAG: winged helix-turn-helix domain-containing protein [Burkholderiales bacterium]